MDQFDLVYATFQPQITDNLKETSRPWIGWRGLWSADWIVEDEPYQGQWAMCIDRDSRAPFVWVPESDLIDIVPHET